MNGKLRPLAMGIGFLALWVIPALGANVEFTLTGGEHGGKNVPVRFAVTPPAGSASAPTVEVVLDDGKSITAQLAAPRLLAEGQAAGTEREATFILPEIGAGQKRTATLAWDTKSPAPANSFSWSFSEGKFAELAQGKRPVLRYMHEKLDESTKERRGETYKVYHHVFDPAGQRLLTKGPGGLFPHHRGLYYGFNKISYGGKTADTWHCNNGEFQSHEKFLASEAGPVFGRHRLSVDWHGKDGQVFAHETRELTAYNVPGGTLIEFASRLESTVGTVKLDGDPQHAGFQFRATQEVPDKTKQLTYYVRPDGADKPGSFRNWPANKEHANLPWNAVSIVLDDQRYTVGYLDHPRNPKEARYSERDYARFGSYFEYELKQGKPLDLNYRIWVQAGEMTPDHVAAHSHNFVAPPQVSVAGR